MFVEDVDVYCLNIHGGSNCVISKIAHGSQFSREIFCSQSLCNLTFQVYESNISFCLTISSYEYDPDKLVLEGEPYYQLYVGNMQVGRSEGSMLC